MPFKFWEANPSRADGVDLVLLHPFEGFLVLIVCGWALSVKDLGGKSSGKSLVMRPFKTTMKSFCVKAWDFFLLFNGWMRLKSVPQLTNMPDGEPRCLIIFADIFSSFQSKKLIPLPMYKSRAHKSREFLAMPIEVSQIL